MTQPLSVEGVAGDALDLFTQGQPVSTGTTEREGQTWQTFDLNHDGQLDLLVQQAVLVNLH